MTREKTLLRLLSCGSVDDGKSTLIGRLLYDCGTLFEDQLTLLEKERTSEGLPDFSCLLDGLLAEREQAITIDAAYRSFSTASRRYIIADAPGHEQYTRNMITAASHADAALILIDVTRVEKSLLPQTRRHTYITSLLGISDVIFAVNKMDRCDFDRERFEFIREKCRELGEPLSFRSMRCIPVSALRGDNVCRLGESSPWYEGPTLLEMLETIAPVVPKEQPFRMPVQWVARAGDFRGVSGTVVAGSLEAGQEVLAQPSGVSGRIKRIVAFDGDREAANAEDAVCLELEPDLDISRGEILTAVDAPLEVADQYAAKIVWLNDPPMVPGRTYLFRHGTMEGLATVGELSSVLDLATMSERPGHTLLPNDIGRIKFSLNRAIPATSYVDNHDLGGFLLIDRLSGNTVGAGMLEHALRRSHNVVWQRFSLGRDMFASQKGQRPGLLWFTGLSGAGKSTIADHFGKELFSRGKHIYLLDGDNLRHGLNRDLGFTEADRAENIRRAGEVAKVLVDAGLIVLATFISPFRADRLGVRELFAPGEFHEIFVDTPLNVCVNRDPKGLYKKALAGEIPNFTGVSSPFEAPTAPDVRLDGTRPLDALVGEMAAFFMDKL